MLNVLHLPHREDRRKSFENEFSIQGILDYKIHNGFTDSNPINNISRGHKKIVQEARQLGLPFVIIAEDDIKFTHPNSYRRFLETMPFDCDIFLASIYHGDIKEDNTVEDFSGMTLYAVMEQFYDTFLSIPERSHIDRSLAKKGKFVVANPFLAIQHDGYSDARKRMAHDGIKLKGRKLYNGED